MHAPATKSAAGIRNSVAFAKNPKWVNSFAPWPVVNWGADRDIMTQQLERKLAATAKKQLAEAAAGAPRRPTNRTRKR